ncbi:ABC transporter permease [Candidatus Woesearchaeota archaeon]|nr:ABC transporter permease [Candidatus Woesearchaeota archaeon]
MFVDYVRLALNNLTKRRLRSWLTMIGIFMGIAVVVSLISLGQGMQKAITDQFVSLGTDKITIQTKGLSTGAPGANTDILLTTGDRDKLKGTRGVLVSTGRLVEPVILEFNDFEKFVYMASVPEDLAARAMVEEASKSGDENMVFGRALKPSDAWKAVVSEEYFNSPKFDGKNFKVGDKVSVNGQTVDIVGMFKKTGNPMFDGAVLMNEKSVRQLLSLPDKYGLLLVQAVPGENMDLLAERITKDLRNYRNVEEDEEDFSVETPEELIETFTSVLDVVTGVLVGIAAISLLVGGIGIMNTMYTAVIERTREIGVMKAIGARNSDIMMIFTIESGMLGMAGGAIGIVLGMGMSKLVELAATLYLGSELIKASFPWYLILGSLAFSFIVGTIAGMFPAYIASKLQPVEALRE